MAERQLLIRILGDAKEFLASIGEAGDKSEGLSGKLKGLGTVLAGALSVGAVTDFAKGAVDAFEDVAKTTIEMQRLTGGTAESMSRLRFAFEESGISADSAEGAMKKFSKAIEAGIASSDKTAASLAASNVKLEAQKTALEGLKNPTEAQTAQLQSLTDQIGRNNDALDFMSSGAEKYGISLTDATGKTKDMHTILMETADVFKNMPDGIDKNAMAMKLFGKSGTDMLPFLNRGAEGIADLEKESDKLGLTLGQSNVDDMKKNIMAQREFHAALEGLKVQIGEKLMPVITALSVWMAENLPKAIQKAKDMWASMQPILQQVVTVLRDNFMPIVKQVWGFLQDNQWVLIAVGVVIFALVAPIAAAVVAFVALVTAIGYAWNNFETFRNIVNGVMTTVETIIRGVLGGIEAFWRTWGDTITTLFTGVFNAIRDYLQGVMDVLRGIFNVFAGLFTGDWGRVWDGIRQIFGGVWEMIKGELELFLAEIRALVSVGLKLLAGVFDAAWEGIKAAVGLAIDAIVFYFVGLPMLILNALKDLGSLLVQSGMDLLQGLRDGIETVAQALWGWLRAFPMYVVSQLGSLANTLMSAGNDLLQGLLVGASDTADRLWEWLRSVPFYIIDQIGNLDRILYEAGRAVLTGLWDGMKAVWNDMTGWIGSIGGWIGNLKGPLDKDKVLLQPQGLALMSGLHEGMKAGWSPVENWLASRQTKLTGSLSGVSGGAAGRIGGGQVIYVNFNNPQFTSPGSVQLVASDIGRGLKVALRGAVSA